jgi:hypothetical protein
MKYVLFSRSAPDERTSGQPEAQSPYLLRV